MGRAYLACYLLFTATSVAHAGIVVELLPDMAPPNADGTYNGGEALQVDVRLISDTAVEVRLLQFDHTASSPALILGVDINNGQPVYAPTPEHPFDGVPNFLFDYSSLSDPTVYTDFSNLQAGVDRRPWPASTVHTDLSGTAGDLLTLEAGLPFHAGAMPVTLPTLPDTYVLDLLNEGVTDLNLGALVVFGGPDGTPTTTWSSAADGMVEITYALGGGPALFTVIPEPATLFLLSIGGLGVLSRRRSIVPRRPPRA
jgi:hypothetical protein